MKIVGDHIILRVVENSDLEFLFKWENDPEIQKFNSENQKLSLDEIQQFIDGHHDIYNDKQLRLMIVLQETNKPIGTLDVFDYDLKQNSFGVGIVIFDAKNRRQGHASKSMDLFFRYASSHLGIKKIFCNIDPNNKVSANFFKSKGFEKVDPKAIEQFSDKNLDNMDFYILNIQ